MLMKTYVVVLTETVRTTRVLEVYADSPIAAEIKATVGPFDRVIAKEGVTYRDDLSTVSSERRVTLLDDTELEQYFSFQKIPPTQS